MEWRVQSGPGSRVTLEMISRFLPLGLAGLTYWHVLLPVHDWLFKGTLRRLVHLCGGKEIRGPEIFAVDTAPQCRL